MDSLGQQRQPKQEGSMEEFNVEQFLNPHLEEQKIYSMPLEFQYVPVEILSKQFTKLNSEHKQKIHYLGPRFVDTLAMHKKLAYNDRHKYLFQELATPQQHHNKVRPRKNSHRHSQVVQHGNQKLHQEHEQSKMEQSSNSVQIMPEPRCHISFYNSVQRYHINNSKMVQSFFMAEKLKSNHFYKTAIYYRAFEGMNPSLNLEQQYVFNSAFESGNLDCVIKVPKKQNEFDLFLRIDSNTRGHIQWFFFSVKNGCKRETITLHICNLTKPGTLYETGMKPYVYSEKRHQNQNREWQQDGGNLSFEKQQLRYQWLYQKTPVPAMYCLTLEYQFTYENDQVFFAYCIPYTYSEMQHRIKSLPEQYAKSYILGRSLAGLDIPLLHITDFGQKKQKKNVIITGRHHPGQSNSSHMLFGFIQFLTSNQKEAVELRKRVNMLIIPMVNPDGVVLGNSRSSAAGKDLNREYIEPNKDLYPEVNLVKEFTYRVQLKYGVLVYLDFHGHSRKKNTFFYGPDYKVNQLDYYKCRILPKLVQKYNCAFRFHSCSFNLSEEKKKTARAAMFNELKIPFTYTVESSIGYYYDCQKMNTFEYCRQSWADMGAAICKATSTFFVSYQQYEDFIRQRRLERQRRQKKQKQSFPRSLRINFEEDQIQDGYQKPEPLRIFYNKTTLFADVISELKRTVKVQTQTKHLDDQLSSDDHDQGEDLQKSKLKQFNALITQNAGKATHTDKYSNSKASSRRLEMQKNLKKLSSLVFIDKQQELNLMKEVKIDSEVQKPKTSLGSRRNWKIVQSRTRNIEKSNLNQHPSFDGKSAGVLIQPTKTSQQVSKSFAIKSKRVASSTSDRSINEPYLSRPSNLSEYSFPQGMNPQVSLQKEHKKLLLKKQQSYRQRNRPKTKQRSHQNLGGKNNRPTFFSYNMPTQFSVEKKTPIEFKFGDTIEQASERTRGFGHSVKINTYRMGGSKSQRNGVCPSSLYGMRQHYSAKKRAIHQPIIMAGNFEQFEVDPQSFTVKTIKK